MPRNELAALPHFFVEHLDEPAGAQVGGAVAERADAGQHDVAGGAQIGRLARDADVGADGSERIGNRAQVAHAVVNDSDATHRRSIPAAD